MDLSLSLRGVRFPGPVGTASGTFGYAKEYESLVDFSKIAAVYTKAVTPEPRIGNPAPRLVETASGMLNSIGLANVGVEAFIRDKMPFLRTIPSKIVVNVAGSTDFDYEAVIEALEPVEGIDGYEINVSCPNVNHGGLGLGTDPTLVAAITKAIRARTQRPLIIKLSPNVTDIAAIALAAEAEGADAVSCVNTLVGMVIDLTTKKPVLPWGTGGLSGPAILPVAVAAVYKVSRKVSIPVIGLGGISRWEDAVQHLLAGASMIQVGSGTFANPALAQEVAQGIESWARREGVFTMAEIHELAR